MNANTTMFDQLPAASELNKVPGFDPRRFLRKKVSEVTQEEVLDLDLKYKKLWFRLKYPAGRIKVTALKITEQIAIIEAKIFFDKNDTEPVSSYISQRYAKEKQGSLYIERAQYAAQDQALTDAGFGVQFSPAGESSGAEIRNEPSAAAQVSTQDSADAKQPPMQDNAPTQAVQATATPVEPVQVAETPVDAVPQDIVVTATETTADLPDTSAQPEDEAPTAEAGDEQPEESTQEAPEQVRDSIPDAAIEQPQSDTPAVVLEFAGNAETSAASPSSRFTADMPVDEICALMTPEEAESVVVDTGTCKDWTLSEVAAKRPASLKWYLNGYQGQNNLLKAGAKILLESGLERKAG